MGISKRLMFKQMEEDERESLQYVMQDMLDRSSEMFLSDKEINFLSVITIMNPKDWSVSQLEWIQDLNERYISIDCAMRQD